ncbi:methyltransferase domain-containing protein [Vibrio rotiferianus]|uniref:Methyltransferase domain-containing protein n=1 Tax=Vibrio rotiferianus TaxID=190895 RepID=A0A7Y4E4A3_9VIBR|nr:methyltransferase domain-containing protein [Vibrio rotiferianus]NOH51163.1 methyltransferase domain-containing protein [Vibrio rotiferianus]
MRTKRTVGETLTHKSKEKLPNTAFHVMTLTMKIVDIFWGFSDKNFGLLGLKKGQTVIDYGCGPARYIKNASDAVGDSGKVIAVDIHPLAIKKVVKKISKYNLSNVEVVHCSGYDTSIDDEVADVIYALDIFHMIEQPNPFLAELSRLAKKEGVIIIADGHQPRSSTLKKSKRALF